VGVDYTVTWVTDRLAVGRAPASPADLETIRAQGIEAILNLCGEFCDLHEIEADRGFEVYYLDLMDECAPDMAALEKAVEWLEKTIDAGTRVLVHCHHGIGRTGTLVMAFLLRQGYDMKTAEKAIEKSGARPSNHCQWKALRTYRRKLGPD
jgi:protein-tyrosine phosphatase